MNAPVSRRTFGKLGNRIGARIALDIPGELMLPQRVQRCTIVDVSRSGTRLRMDRLPITAPPRVGAQACLRLFEQETLGTVIWARADGCAVQFDQPMAPADLERLRWIAENREDFIRSQLGQASALWR